MFGYEHFNNEQDFDFTDAVPDRIESDSHQILPSHTKDMTCLAVSKNWGKRDDRDVIISGSLDQRVTICKRVGKSWTKQDRHTIAFEHLVFTVALAPDENSLFVGGGDGGEDLGYLKCYHMDSFKERKDFKGHTAAVFSVAVTSDGEKLVSGSEDKTIIVWDVESGDKIRTLEGHSSSVRSVAITPDQPIMIVSGSEDNTAKLWEIGEKQYRDVSV